MKKLFLIPLLALAAACSPIDTAASVGGLPPPVEVADQSKLDEKVGLAVETLYTATAKAGALAFRAGLVAPSANPLVHQEGFCRLVWQGQFTITDLGSRVNSLECQLRRARDLTRAAYDAANQESYDRSAREAIRIGKELLALIGGN